LDLEIVFYHAMSQDIQSQRNLKNKPSAMPQKILVRTMEGKCIPFVGYYEGLAKGSILGR